MKKNKHIHFIGICGVAMSALALAFKKNGWKVTGSDAGFFPPVSDYLKKNNIDFYPGWHPERIGKPDLIVVGNVASSTNPEWQYVQKNKLNYKSYPEVIAEYFVKQNSIVCAGTYGKTTISALLSWILTQAGYKLSYMFGGLAIDDFDSAGLGNVMLSASEASPVTKADPSTPLRSARDDTWSVLEGDEYKSARWDNSPKFSHYSPTHLLLTSIQWDHADVYPTEDSYTEVFQKLVESIPEKGLIVLSENIKILKYHNIQYSILKTYGKSENVDYKFFDVKAEKSGVDFKINHNSEIYNLKSPMFGEFMAENITACFAMARQIGIEAEKIISAVESFKGLKRRLEKRFEGKVTIFDDIAHSPAKAGFTLNSLRKIYDKKIIAVFEPNTGNRQPEAIPNYSDAFSDADEVIIPRLTKIKIGSGKQLPLDGRQLAEVIAKNRKNSKYIDNDEELVDYLIKNTSNGDVVVFLGSHGFRGMINNLIDKLKEKNL